MKWNLANEPTGALVSVWSISSTADLGSIRSDVDSHHGDPYLCSPAAGTINMLAARGERESVQLAVRPKMSWTSSAGISGSAGVVHVQCSDLFSSDSHGNGHPIRLAANPSVTLRRVIPILGIPDALVPLANTSSTHRQDRNYCPNPVPGVAADVSVILGETTLLWLSIDVPSSQPCALYEGEVTVSAVHTPVAPGPMPLPRSSANLNHIPSTTPAPSPHAIYTCTGVDNGSEALARNVTATSTGCGKEAAKDALVSHLDIISQSASMLSVVGSAESFSAVKTALMELLLLSPLFGDPGHSSIKGQDHHTATKQQSQDQLQQQQEEGVGSGARKQAHDLKPTDRCVFVSPASSEIVSCEHRELHVTMSKPIRMKLTLRVWNWSIPVTPSLPAVFGISEKVVEKEYGDLVRGSERWFKVLDMHYEWLLSYRVSPYFCRWSDDMSVLCYTCPRPADHPRANECYSDPRLAAYAVPYKLPVSEQSISAGQGMSSTPRMTLDSQMSEGVRNILGNTSASEQTMSADQGMPAELIPGKRCKSCSGGRCKSCSGDGNKEENDDNVSCATSNYSRERMALRREVLLLKERPHWTKAYFYLWDEPLTVDQYNLLQQRAEEIMNITADARILTTYYCGPREIYDHHLQHPHHPGQLKEKQHPEHLLEAGGETMPSSGTRDSASGTRDSAFENFLRVPDLMRPWTRIFCTSEWALGGCEDRAKQILGKLRRHKGEEWWTSVWGLGVRIPTFTWG
ncbi:hypothetical protein CBR_g6514 [Chara braunii]|uniref:Uncharacterized protein n=1 Tax=Chara braunii TaxID=69332 RepID=A0A388KK34_CHABU|nr:hypothetical protein CBR_g6514 [Chara braunii]|eukprot:GBG70386.1 hypothetical protein CBR_g6514 [Chara braunii]